MKITKMISCCSIFAILLAAAFFIFSDSVEAYTEGYYNYTVYTDGTAGIKQYTGDEVNCVIPEKLGGHTVTVIEFAAFEKKEFMQTVKIPSTVKRIESQAFKKSTVLKSLTIPDSVTEIESYICQNCTGLESVVIGKGVKKIPNGAFGSCTSLKNVTLPYGLEIIKGDTGLYGAFYNCTSLTTINIPSTVTTIEEVAFNKSGLITLSIPDNVISLEYGSFKDCSSLKSVTIGSGLKKISRACFTGCTSLETVTIKGNTLETIGEDAFYGCSTLTEITIPSSLDKIESYAFYKCSSLKLLELNEGLGKIGQYAFAYSKISDITIPSTVTIIGDRIFDNCTSLETIKLLANVVDDTNNSSVIIGVPGNKPVVYCYENSQYLTKLRSNASGYTVETMNAVVASSISVNPTKLEINAGDRAIISYVLSPFNSTDSVEFISSNTSIAKVNQHGIVTGVARGSVLITARTNTGVIAQISVVVYEHPKTLSFSLSSKSLKVGEIASLPAKVDSGNRTDVPVTYTSSNSDVAKVDANGNVRAIAPGTAVITASVYNGLKATIKITVTYGAVKNVSFSVTKKTMAVKQQTTMKALVDNGVRKDVIIRYQSSNTSVVTVNSSGTVTAKKAGTAYIIASAGGKSAKVIITVKKAPSRIKFKNKTVKLKPGKTIKLKYSLTKNSYTYKLTWSSSNKKISTVDSKGKVTAIKKGKCKITVKTHNGKKASVKINVK